MNSAKEMVQWHPAMGACLQIEFEEEKDKLSFEPEHLLAGGGFRTHAVADHP